jgi:hypothetical protein
MSSPESYPFNPAHPSALAVYCSDGRFTEAVEQLLRSLGHGRLDVLCLPGGPGLLTHWSATVSDADMVRRSASFLIRSHAITSVVLLAHRGCGYYRQRLATVSPSEIHARQVQDLRAAAAFLETAHPSIKLLLYYADVVAEQIVFHPLTRS